MAKICSVVLLLAVINTLVCNSYSQTTCVCDLTTPSCDVNCCCDPDCNGTDTATFSTCLDTGFTTDTLQCVYDQVVFVNNLPTTTQVRQNGVFCIQRDMFAQRNFFTDPACIATGTCFNQVTNLFTFQQSQSTSPTFGTFYRSGDPIYVIYSTNETGFFNVPSSGVSNNCLYTPVQYLASSTSACSWYSLNSNSICIDNPALQCTDFANSFKIAPTPDIFAQVMNETYPYNSTLLVSITDNFVNCTANASCADLVSSVTFTFTTNGTVGIVSVSATQNTIPNQGSNSFAQTYSVEFTDINAATTVIQRSGNPGYLVGRPLIAGQSNDSATNIIVNLNPNVGITVMQQTSTDSCDNVTDTPILFGEDTRVGCKLTFSSTSNCTLLQEQIYTALDRSNLMSTTLFVASFGNTSASNIDPTQWITLTTPTKPTRPTTPGPIDNPPCGTMILGAQYQFLFAYNGDIANPQAQLVDARYEYTAPQTLEFVCFNPTCSNTQSVEISLSVSFIDVSETPVSVLQAQPTIEAQLPSDFFFPFKSSAATIPSVSYMLIIATVFLSYQWFNIG